MDNLMNINGYQEPLEYYQDILASFCYHMALLAQLAFKTKEKSVLDAAELIEFNNLQKRIAFLQEQFISIKTKLNFPGGISFLENNRFAGFEIIQGQLQGDISMADRITAPWLEEALDADSCYRYEVANYIHFLCHPNCLDITLTETSSVKTEKKQGFFTSLYSKLFRNRKEAA